MTTTTFPNTLSQARPPRAARAVLRQLERLRHGTLAVRLPDGSTTTFGSGEPHAGLEIHSWDALAQVALKGDIGAAETFVAGGWRTPDLPLLLSVLLRNRRELHDIVYGHWLGNLADRLFHLLRRNSRAGSRRNIEAHYDLGNSFYRLWLDETWNYSSALFTEGPAQPLEEAQRAKVRRALDAAGVGEGSRLLEIGCGWGALAETAAVEYRAHVTGVTLSKEQLAHAMQRLAHAAPGSADLRLQDYRDIADGPYDAICSIEMVEAVGREYWPRYFETVARLLKPGGKACIQTIVIDDALWPRYIRGTDFIQRYVFPGGCLPCPAEFERHAMQAGLRVADRFAFGKDYALTLRLWRERFMARRDEVAALGFGPEFLLLWEFYLAYCEAAFEQGDTDVMQYTLQKP